jgi:hypothetical protein
MIVLLDTARLIVRIAHPGGEMKRVAIILILTVIAALSCTKTKEIEIRLTNPQNLALHFDGFYRVNSEDSLQMTGTTPQDFDFSFKKGDQLIGQIWKSDSTNYSDTLRFQVFVDGVEHTNMNYSLIIPFSRIQFTLSVQ